MYIHTHRVLIFAVTMLLAIHGLLGLFVGGFKLSANYAVRVLLQNPSTKSAIKGSKSTNAVQFLKTLDFEVIDQVVTAGLELYKALVVCCVSCCELWRILRIVCAVLAVFLLHSAVNIYLLFERRAVMGDVLEDLEGTFVTNFYTLYRDTHGAETNARFTFEMNGVQVLFKCCGVHSYLDYANASLWKAGPGLNMTVPPTCCRLERYSFLLLNCIIFFQEPCMIHPTLENSSMGQGCFQALLSIMRLLFLESLVWNCISALLYISILVLFLVQIRFWAHKTEDPFEGLRGFLKETQNIVQEMEVGENLEKEKKKGAERWKTLVKEYRGSIQFMSNASSKGFYDVVLLAMAKEKAEKQQRALEISDSDDNSQEG